jgi:hypothetical protein
MEIKEKHLKEAKRENLVRLARFEGLDKVVILEKVDDDLLVDLLADVIRERHYMGTYGRVRKEKIQIWGAGGGE